MLMKCVCMYFYTLRRNFFLVPMVVPFTVACVSLMQTPNAKSLSVNVSPLLLLHIIYIYIYVQYKLITDCYVLFPNIFQPMKTYQVYSTPFWGYAWSPIFKSVLLWDITCWIYLYRYYTYYNKKWHNVENGQELYQKATGVWKYVRIRIFHVWKTESKTTPK